MKLLGNSKSKITKNENIQNVPNLEINEINKLIKLVNHCNIANNDYQQNSRVLYNSVSNKSFDKLLNIPPTFTLF